MLNRMIVEAQILAEPNKTGVEEYAEKLLQAYMLLNPDSPVKLAFFGYKPKHVRISGGAMEQKMLPVHVRIARKLNSYKLMPPLEWFFGKGVYLFPHFVWWRTGSSPSISVIHDTVYFNAPETMDEDNLRYMLRTIPRTVKNSDIIITISQSAKNDIIANLGVAESKIRVLYPGVDEGEYTPATKAEVAKMKAKLGIKKDYILFQSTLEPRKNILNILTACSSLSDKAKKRYCLVLAGKPGWHFQETKRHIDQARKLGLEIIETGYVDDEDNPALFTGASVLVSPSFYEGFGMNLLKAMICKTPVVTSNISSMPEVVGKYGVLVDPYDPKDIAKGIESVLTDAKLASKLSNGGPMQAKKFRWENSAKKLSQIIEDLA